MKKPRRSLMEEMLSTKSNPAKTACVIANKSNQLLEPDLYKICHDWNAKRRATAARKLARWADQLVLSARKMDPTIATDSKPPARMPKGFFLVNISQWEKEELLALAKVCRWELRTALRRAVVGVKYDLRECASLKRLIGRVEKFCISQPEKN